MAGKAVQRRPLRIPQDPLHLQSGNQFYFQRLFLTNSVSQFHSCHHRTIAQTLIFLYQLWWIVGHILGDQSIRTPWRCGYTHISTFPGRIGGFVPVTHAARECTGDLRSLAKSRWFRVRHLSHGLRRLGDLAVRWWRQWWRLESSGKRMLGALGDCKITVTVIKYGVWFSCSIYGHYFRLNVSPSSLFERLRLRFMRNCWNSASSSSVLESAGPWFPEASFQGHNRHAMWASSLASPVYP